MMSNTINSNISSEESFHAAVVMTLLAESFFSNKNVAYS